MHGPAAGDTIGLLFGMDTDCVTNATKVSRAVLPRLFGGCIESLRCLLLHFAPFRSCRQLQYDGAAWHVAPPGYFAHTGSPTGTCFVKSSGAVVGAPTSVSVTLSPSSVSGKW